LNATSQKSKSNNAVVNALGEQKATIQEIAKNIFYIYKNKHTSTQTLDDSLQEFLVHQNYNTTLSADAASDAIKKQNEKISLLWSAFHQHVKIFQEQNRVNTAYTNIILEQTIKEIYKTNLLLVQEFEKLTKLYQKNHNEALETDKKREYILLFILLALLAYFFTQINQVIVFVQKFVDTSKKIIANASIKELKQIQTLNAPSQEVEQATANFNLLVDNINKSILYSSQSIENAYQSLEFVEKSIENLLELVSVMQGNKDTKKELAKKEDALIESLEELTTSTLKLQNLKIDLDNLISHNTLKNS